MSSGNVQLVAVGAQDEYLSGDPSVSFFRTNYKRHTNFSIFQQSQTIQGNPNPGGMSVIKFERYGDLLNYTYLTLALNDESQLISEWSNVIESTELVIGGQVIDTQDVNFTQEIAIDTLATSYSKSYPASLAGGVGSQSFFYPFRFFFCENWTSSIPLVALQYHDVELRIKWGANYNTNYKPDISATYMCLDEDERKFFAEKTHDMLVFQVQKSPASNKTIQDVTFNHPVKFIASSNATANSLVSRTNKVKLEANGVDITDLKYGVPHFTSIPSYYHTEFSSGNNENMFFYSFALNASKHQPTGTLNFSRLDSFKIHCSQAINRPIYAVNYNILRIQNGLGGLLFSN